MALSIKTNRMLWGRAASRCSLSNCRRELVIDPTDTDDPSLVGEAAHIVAEQPDGPRGDSPLSVEQRNKYDNLILLCNIHHKQVDDQPNHFTVEQLKTLKTDHERWVRETLTGFDPIKQADDERWAGYVEEWTLKTRLDEWYEETSWLLGPIPEMREEFYQGLRAIPNWLLSRVWPGRYPNLRKALESFGHVVSDFLNVFGRYSTSDGSIQRTERFYKIREWNPELYELLSKRFDFHVDLVQDLTCEMTRSANYVSDLIRQHLDQSFRIAQGVLLVRRGPGMDLKDHTYRLEYQPEERIAHPYPGLDEFVHLRASRDVYFGEGSDPT